jgi:hypothetical protein
MDHTFTDPDYINGIGDFRLVLTATSTIDELDRYLKMNIEDIYK